MDKKSQALIIILWILVILTVLAVSVGHRVALALRLSRYQREGLRAYYLAKSAVNLAIEKLLADNNSFDYLQEDWADNEDVFKENRIFGNENEYITIGYLADIDSEDMIYGVADESSRININEAPKEVLGALFNECGLDSVTSDNLANEFLKWRGSLAVSEDEDLDYKTAVGYVYKKDKFITPEEIDLLKGVQELDEGIVDRIKSLITVFGSTKTLNINTASAAALNIVARSVVNSAEGTSDSDASFLSQQIINSRLTDKYPFQNVDIAQMYIAFGVEQATGPGKILSRLVSDGLIGVQSGFFRINASGVYNSVSKNISVVFYRHSPAASESRIVWWHQN